MKNLLRYFTKIYDNQSFLKQKLAYSFFYFTFSLWILLTITGIAIAVYAPHNIKTAV